MGYSLELERSSRQQEATKSVKEKAISPQARRNLKFKDKHRAENTFVQPSFERCHELRRNVDDVPIIQLKHSGNHQKKCFESCTKKGDELVKHMSNLPGYLQQIKRGDNFQEKALNFGVLEWKHLERWKYNEKLFPARGPTKASSSGSNSPLLAGGSSTVPSRAQSKILSSQRKQPSSHGWRLNLAYEERQGVQSQRKVSKPLGFETSPWSTLDGQRNLRMKDKASGRKYCEKKLDIGKRKESNHMTTSGKETSSLGWRKHGLPISSHDMTNARDGETNMAVEKEFNFARQSCTHESIVLLLPKVSPKKSCSESGQLSKSRTSFDGDFTEVNGKRISGCFSPEEELHSVELYSEISHSCPLPLNGATNIGYDMEQCSLVNSRGVELQFDASRMHQRPKEVPSIASNVKSLEVNSLKTDPSTTIETPRRLDHDIAEQPGTKGRHPSPSRRFSFSNLGRMTRSLSFKDGPTVPKLSSSFATVKSGPVGSEASSSLDKFNRDNTSASNRARSSPLRRLLDPLLKPRGGLHLAETVKLSKENLTSVSLKPMNTSELLRNQKHETSSIQALLQLTLNNGLPLFKLVVDNSSDILAAAVKQLPTPGEDASSLIYALYSVHEIKKKSGSWISQGSIGKSSSFGYNIIGQMKVSSSCPPYICGQNTKDQYVARESVLYDVDIGQADKETPEFKPSKVLAATVIKNPSRTGNDGKQSYNSNLCSQDGFTKYFQEDGCNGEENENFKSTIVILGGIHGLPNKGVQSPLTNLWTYGGSCDCGGWDIGCKLQILTNQDQNSNVIPPVSCSTEERLDLFVEGGHQEKKPIFSLAPFKSGVYSVEFSPSISLLQGFFISVAFLSSQKLFNVFEVKLEAKSFTEARSDTMKIPTTIQGQIPVKQVTNPPLSPVARV